MKQKVCVLNWQRKMRQQPTPDAITSRRYPQRHSQPPATPSRSQQAEAQQKILEKQLADAGAELARLNQARASDQAELVAEQVQVNQLSQQLKTATTNIDMERQLAVQAKMFAI